MPLPKPKRDETRYRFIDRCINDVTIKREYPDPDQRIAVCSTIWKQEITQ